MTFKEECLQEYQNNEKRREKEAIKRTKERRTKDVKQILTEVENKFGVKLTEENLIEKIMNGVSYFEINLEGVRLKATFRNYWCELRLIVPCVKCGKDTTYRDSITSKTVIGSILTNLNERPDYMKTCPDCKYEEDQEKQIKRNTDYEDRKEKREKNTLQKLADVIAEVLREGGYRDLYNDEVDDY